MNVGSTSQAPGFMTFGTITARWMHHGWRGAMPVAITYLLVCMEMEQDAGNKPIVQWRKFLVFFYRYHCGDQNHHDSAGGFCSALTKLFFLGERHWTRCLHWLHGASIWCSGDDFPEWICMGKGFNQIWQAKAWQNITGPLPWRSFGGIGAISSSSLVWHHLGKEERMCLCAFCAKHLEKGPQRHNTITSMRMHFVGGRFTTRSNFWLQKCLMKTFVSQHILLKTKRDSFASFAGFNMFAFNFAWVEFSIVRFWFSNWGPLILCGTSIPTS